MPHANATGTLRLGDIDVARIGLGTNRLTNTRERSAFVKDAVAAGANHIDTAHSYTRGQSEETVDAALSWVADEVVVATKGGYRAGEGRPEVLRAQIEESLIWLRTDAIALYYLHRVDPETPLEASLATIKEYRDIGKIRHVGLSQVGIDEIERAREIVPLAAVQNHYNLSERRYEDVVDYCAGASPSCLSSRCAATVAGRSPTPPGPRPWRPCAVAPTRSRPGSCASSAGATWCPRSGWRTRPSGPSASAPASACTWSSTGPPSRTASTRPSSSTAASVRSRRAGRQFLERVNVPEPWRGTMLASLRLIDELDRDIDRAERALRALGAEHRYIPRLMSCPGIGWVLGCTIASEIGDITRFGSPTKLVSYTGLVPRVHQSGQTDRRGPLTKHGPRSLRWALIEAAHTACRFSVYANIVRRLGRERGPKVAAITIGRKLAEAIWHMLTRDQPFAPAGAASALTA